MGLLRSLGYKRDCLTFDEATEQTESYKRNLLLGNDFSMAYGNSRFFLQTYPECYKK